MLPKPNGNGTDHLFASNSLRNNACATALRNVQGMAMANSGGGLYMSIKPYLDDLDVDPETKRVLGVALEKARVSLGLADDFANGIIAKRIVEIAETGERGYLWVGCPEPHLRPECEVYDSWQR